jgi:hypothetical protein
MNERHVFLLIGIALLTLALISVLPPVHSSNSNEESEEAAAATGQISNSKYLTVSALSYAKDDDKVNITGTITNIDTKDSFNRIVAVGELYDRENRLITAVSGLANSATLEPQQQTVFTITATIPSNDEVGRYVVLPGGSAVED